MHFSTITGALTLALSATPLASSFVIHTFSDEWCQDYLEEVNVWDNSCATWPKAFSSYAPIVYGGEHQKAYMWAADNCGDLATTLYQVWADGGAGSDFHVGNCWNFGDGHQVSAIASYSD